MQQLITDRLKEEVLDILQYNSAYNISEVRVSEILQDWSNKKSHFYHLFGNKTILKTDKEITIEKSEEELQSIFNLFCSEIGIFALYSDANIFIVKEFLNIQGYKSFSLNKVHTDFNLPNGKTIKSGMKISRAFGMIIKENKVLEKIQTKYSMILQDITVKGKLFLSIHPLDYLSLSETNSNWHSCHALDGEYASGNLNYLTDSATVVAYLATDEEVKLKRFNEVKWFSKKWRTLLYISEDLGTIVASKNYPFKSEELTYEVIKNMQKQISGEWKTILPILTQKMAETLVKDAKETVHFNDCLLSRNYRGWYTRKNDAQQVIVGAPVKCMQCGEYNIIVGGSEFTCSSCSGIILCTCCGCSTLEEDALFHDESIYCYDCSWEFLTYCEGCGEYYDAEIEEMHWSDDDSCYYCESCHQEEIDEV